MTEHFSDIQDANGNIVARVVYNPNQQPESVPYWIEVSSGYDVFHGKQACHDRANAPRVRTGVK